MKSYFEKIIKENKKKVGELQGNGKEAFKYYEACLKKEREDELIYNPVNNQHIMSNVVSRINAEREQALKIREKFEEDPDMIAPKISDPKIEGRLQAEKLTILHYLEELNKFYSEYIDSHSMKPSRLDFFSSKATVGKLMKDLKVSPHHKEAFDLAIT